MQSQLESGLHHYQIQPSQQQLEHLLAYIELLQKWNNTYNLTAIKQPEEILNRHVFDSCSIHSYIQGDNCLDVGTGPGLPGLILAILQPDKHWTLLDSNQKKTRFLRHVQMQLKLDNVDVVNARVESFHSDAGFSTIVCRAFSSLFAFHQQARHLLQSTGVLLAMKAQIDEQELNELKPVVSTLEKIELDVIDETTQRCLIRLTD